MKRYNLKVIANSKEDSIKFPEKEDEPIVIKVKKPAVKGKANREVIKLLKKHFKADVEIVLGKTSNKKIIEVKDN